MAEPAPRPPSVFFADGIATPAWLVSAVGIGASCQWAGAASLLPPTAGGEAGS